ncbi:iron(III) transport system substrate-binding protein [Sphingomonas jinjuensis]|uniref:Iron(III) transport system substrate-binding protein n=1 Tax=Sphingomonas jinjuensis TaxID=535907 RepID=A0A840FFH9_9SPHN|nr:ABC transporter substrate-binding protein [Sphingomonas jinjuensis]MBB4154397.1 iron(III) transport system substrate-binding protein [Sphingomonas jinjuensis]
MRRLFALVMPFLLAACGAVGGDGPAGVAARAEREGQLVIWSSTDRPVVGELLADFRARHPAIRLRYVEMPALPIHRLVQDRARSGGTMPDIVWTSAMDLQIKLVNDGHALRYASPQGSALPSWANWKSEAWGVTAEPIVMVYNRRLLPADARFGSHAELLRVLEARLPLLRDRVATYDIANSAVGYLYLSQDVAASRLAWPIVRALGVNGVRKFPTSEQVIADVSAGRSVIGYNVLGSYAVAERRRNPDVAVVLPADYTLLASRIAVIPRTAPHPDAARLFLDFLLSREGQAHLAARGMPSVRPDMPPVDALTIPATSQRAIRVGPALLVLQDRLTREQFLREWARSTGEGRARLP